MAEISSPNWHPITRLPLIASLIDGALADGQEHYAMLSKARDLAHVLDDFTVERSIKLYTEQRDFIEIFEEQLGRWRCEPLSLAQKSEVDRLDGQLARLRMILTRILELGEELKQGTIEKVLAKSDLELGIEALLRMTNEH